jgi:hypothetical protein
MAAHHKVTVTNQVHQEEAISAILTEEQEQVEVEDMAVVVVAVHQVDMADHQAEEGDMKIEIRNVCVINFHQDLLSDTVGWLSSWSFIGSPLIVCGPALARARVRASTERVKYVYQHTKKLSIVMPAVHPIGTVGMVGPSTTLCFVRCSLKSQITIHTDPTLLRICPGACFVFRIVSIGIAVPLVTWTSCLELVSMVGFQLPFY